MSYAAFAPAGSLAARSANTGVGQCPGSAQRESALQAGRRAEAVAPHMEQPEPSAEQPSTQPEQQPAAAESTALEGRLAASEGRSGGNGSGDAAQARSDRTNGASPAASGFLSDSQAHSSLAASMQLQTQPSLVVFSGGTAFNTVAGQQFCRQIEEFLVIPLVTHWTAGAAHACRLAPVQNTHCARALLLKPLRGIRCCKAPQVSTPSAQSRLSEAHPQGTCGRRRRGWRTCRQSRMMAARNAAAFHAIVNPTSVNSPV